MDHVGRIFRPPSEAESLLLQISVGCSHNQCTYCAMYEMEEQRFRIKPFATVADDIDEAAVMSEAGPTIRRVFLCDGDALILPTDHLAAILNLLKEKIPTVRRVGIYGDARSILHKGPADLDRLRRLGLGIVYHGVESGDDAVLERVVKGSKGCQGFKGWWLCQRLVVEGSSELDWLSRMGWRQGLIGRQGRGWIDWHDGGLKD